MTGPFASPDRRSLLLRMAGTGFQLARYLCRSGTGKRNDIIQGFIKDIFATQTKLQEMEKKDKPAPLFDVEIKLGKNGETEIPKGFEILEEVERV